MPVLRPTRGKLVKPRLCLIYGTPGIGKSSLAKEDALLVDLEGGSDDIDLFRWPANQVDYDGFVEILNALYAEDFAEPTVFFDTADWLESLIEKKVCAAVGVKSLTEVEYGKGPGMMVPYWDFFLEFCDALRMKRGKNVVLLAHAHAVKVAPPGQESYQRYEPTLKYPGNATVREWCDEVFFYHYLVTTTEEKLGFNKTRNIAVGAANRSIQTAETPVALAKNRVGLPMQISSFEEYRPFLAK